MSRTAYSVQKDFASTGLRSEIIWDSYSADQSDLLKQKIRTLFPSDKQNGPAAQSEHKDLFQTIWSQRKYTNRTLLCSIIYVLVTEERDPVRAKQSKQFSCHPVFRTRKCISSNNSAGCCMVFIDENARIYQNWNQYKQNNLLPKGTMIAPASGIYTVNDRDEVKLELCLTPAGKKKSQVLNATDKVASVGGVMAAVPFVAALAIPVAGPIIAVATAATVTTAAYSTLRSVMKLGDRRRHGQSVALTNREARNNWIGVAGGFIGLGATGATKAVSVVTATGRELSLGTKLAVNGINVSSAVLSGSGVAHGIYGLYMKLHDRGKINSTDVLQLAASLAIFTHSINNFQIASRITKYTTAASPIVELKTQLRNNFNTIFKEVKALHGSAGKFDIIRTMHDVPLKDVLMNLHKINSKLNGNIVISTIATSLLPPKILSVLAGDVTQLDLTELATLFGSKFVQHITNFNSFVDVLGAVSKYFCERVFMLLMNLARDFIEKNLDTIDAVLNTFVSTETIIYKMIMQCVKNYENFTYDYLKSKQQDILKEIEKYFNSQNPVSTNTPKRNCPTCKGHFYVCNL